MDAHWKVRRGEGVGRWVKTKAKLKLNWNVFQRGGVGLRKPSMREVWIICGTTHLIARILWDSKFFLN